MIRSLLLSGMLAGLCAGILALGFAYAVGEPQVDIAISFESVQAAARGEAPDPVLVSRTVQSTAGLLTGIGVYGIAFGGLFALAFAAVYGRVRRARPAVTSFWLAAGSFAVVYLVPALKYPANPPSVGSSDTIGTRTALFLGMSCVSLFAAIGALMLNRWLEVRWGRMCAGLIALAAFAAAVVVGMILLPPVNEVPAPFPAVTLWNFRIASLGVQAVMWTTIGLSFAYFAERTLESPRRGAARGSRWGAESGAVSAGSE
jgi:predicted cobalt transporter CbtA